MPTYRSFAAVALLALAAGCHRPPPGPDRNGNRVEAPIAAKNETPRVPCAVDGGEMVDNACTVETAPDGVLTLRNPDGGFHRLRPTADGSAVVAADGADRVRVGIVDGGTVEVIVGGDRYRLPATIKGLAGKP